MDALGLRRQTRRQGTCVSRFVTCTKGKALLRAPLTRLQWLLSPLSLTKASPSLCRAEICWRFSLIRRAFNGCSGAGGCLIFFGLVIWLISLGVFNNPVRVAVLLGVGNAVLVGGGWALMLRTRYQNVGRALTLLACLIMPLNLWFYHANNLVVYQGYLWLPALVCCAVYAASAYVLKDAMFVYTFVGGIALTGLLVLAQQNHFGEVFAPVTLLMILGLLCLHAERAFPDNDSPFSRKKFGLAFFWSAHALIGTGLVLLLYAQFIGLLYNPIFKGLGISQPAVVRHDYLPWTTLLVLAGTYAYVYSDMVVRRVGVYLCLAAVTLLWAEMQLLAWTTPSAAIVIVTLSLTALAVNILQRALVSQHELLRIVPPLGILLSLMPVAYGVLLHFWATSGFAAFKITWDFAGAMAVTAVCCRAGAYLYRHADEKLSMTYFFATAAATLVFAASIASLITLERWVEQAPILMLIPIIYLVASHLYRGHTPEVPLERVAHAATIVMLAYGIKSSLRITVLSIFAVESSTDNLLLALFCLETAAFYALVSYLRRAEWSVYLATGMLCGAIWQLARFARTPDEIYILFFALAGFGLLLAFRFGIVERWNIAGLEKAVFRCANALTVLGFASGVLLSLGRLLSETDFRADHWRVPFVSLLVLLACLSTISVLSAWIVQQQEWRRTYCVVSVINAVLVVLTIHRLMALDPWQTLEVLAILFGAGDARRRTLGVVSRNRAQHRSGQRGARARQSELPHAAASGLGDSPLRPRHFPMGRIRSDFRLRRLVRQRRAVSDQGHHHLRRRGDDLLLADHPGRLGA